MDATSIQTLIGTLGFPIVCVIFLGWFIFKIWMGQQETNTKREDKLYEFIGKAQQVNEQLSNTNAEFVDVLNTYKRDLDSIKEDVSEIKERIGK